MTIALRAQETSWLTRRRVRENEPPMRVLDNCRGDRPPSRLSPHAFGGRYGARGGGYRDCNPIRRPAASLATRPRHLDLEYAITWLQPSA
jgi:hypothetical protein